MTFSGDPASRHSPQRRCGRCAVARGGGSRSQGVEPAEIEPGRVDKVASTDWVLESYGGYIEKE